MVSSSVSFEATFLVNNNSIFLFTIYISTNTNEDNRGIVVPKHNFL
jgi:hypothetical protein